MKKPVHREIRKAANVITLRASGTLRNTGLATLVAVVLVACGSSEAPSQTGGPPGTGGSGGSTGGIGGTGGATGGSGGATGGSGGATGGSGGATGGSDGATGGSGGATGGGGGATGGMSGAGGSAGKADGGTTGGAAGSTGGASGAAGSGGTSGTAGSGGAAGIDGGGGAPGCGTGSGSWPAANPAQQGPYMAVTENNVGPNSAYTMFRPQTLGQAGLKHPVITWGNGTGTMPSTYRTMLTHYASHGFVVIASNSTNVAQGTPPPMLDGVTWVLEQAAVSTSPLYNCIDAAKIGATGHSQGALATTSAGSDARIATIAPIQGSRANTGLHGPAAFFCGGMDTTLPCSGHMSAFNSVTQYPVMLANQLTATHTNWIGGLGSTLNPYAVATTGWFRVHLMGDTALRPMFYGASCTLCQDSATWQIQRKMMD
jgi:hypothetical protein